MVDVPKEGMIVGWHVADCIVDVSGKLEGGLLDWPSHIQDKVFEAIETLNKQKDRQYELLRAFCDYDEDHKWFIHVTVRAPKRLFENGTIQ